MMVPRTVFAELGGFDENYEIGYGDIDFCLRAGEAGYRVVYTPFAELVHHEGGTRGFSVPPNDVLRASNLMYERIKTGDAYFNPNLSYLYRQPTIADPREPDRREIVLRILHEFGLIDTIALEFKPEPGNTLVENPVAIQVDSPTDKNLLLISHELSLTGAPLILLDLARYLIDQDFGITVVSPIHGALQEQLEQMGAEVIINPFILRDAREVLRYLNHCDLIIANTILSWRGVYSAKALSKPCVWWVHESQFGLDYADKYPHVAGAFQAADVQVFPSRQTADIYAAYLNGKPVEIVHNGLNTRNLFPKDAADSIDINKHTFSIVNVASYEPRKGQDILANSLDYLPKNVEVDCYLIGRSLDWWFSQQLAFKAWRRNNLHILGELPHEEVLAYLRSADVFILPSRDEVLPMTLLEAMYFRKPIIASRVGGIPEVITNGEDGMIVDAGDEQLLAEYISRLFSDREYGRQLGEKGYEKLIREFSLEAFTSRWMGIISQLLE
jgi:glycosyltransferase involved in cell wall biosynthesis